MWLWVSYLNSLNFSFFNYKMDIKLYLLYKTDVRIKWDNKQKYLCLVYNRPRNVFSSPSGIALRRWNNNLSNLMVPNHYPQKMNYTFENGQKLLRFRCDKEDEQSSGRCRLRSYANDFHELPTAGLRSSQACVRGNAIAAGITSTWLYKRDDFRK